MMQRDDYHSGYPSVFSNLPICHLAKFLASVLMGLSFIAACSAWAAETSGANVQTEILVSGLEHPWSLAFLPEGRSALITERPGRLRHWSPQTGLSPALRGVPTVFAQGQGGLLDVALHSDFARNRLVYLSVSQGEDRQPTVAPAGTVVGVGRLADDHRSLENFRVIFRQIPKRSSGVHFGSRLVFDGDGYLYVTLGENNRRSTAQDLDVLQGKVVRLFEDGRVPPDNPFVNQTDARPEIWSYGHRNPQGAAMNPWTGQLWVHEHGPRGGDEINIVQAGKNYGWPLATYGINYSGFTIPEALGERVDGTEPPHHWWPVSPAISGMAFYDHARFAAWQRSVFIGALRGQALIRLTLDSAGQQVLAEEHLLQDLGVRIRDVRVGPDGFVYVLTDERNGQLIRLALGD